MWMTNRPKRLLKIQAIGVVRNGRLADDLDLVQLWPWPKEKTLRLWRVQDRKSLSIRLHLVVPYVCVSTFADSFLKDNLIRRLILLI